MSRCRGVMLWCGFTNRSHQLWNGPRARTRLGGAARAQRKQCAMQLMESVRDVCKQVYEFARGCACVKVGVHDCVHVCE